MSAGKKDEEAATAMKQRQENDDDDEASTSSSEAEESGDGDASDASEGSDADEGSDAESVDGDAVRTESAPRADDDGGEEQWSFDAANLLAIDARQVNAAELHRPDAAAVDAAWYACPPTIEMDAAAFPEADESALLAGAAEGTTQLLRELWKLPTERTDAGPIATLPPKATGLPRALPPPPPKTLSKWEQFAKQRGIAPKSKRSRKAFDEATGEWKHLTGPSADRAGAGPESYPILEVKKNDDPMADPWEALREEKRARVDKNVESRMRNAQNAGQLERGSANKFVKNNQRMEKQREIARDRERRQGLVAPAGVPPDMRKNAQRGGPSTKVALRATQTSTASMGKFDRQREGEPEKKPKLTVHGKRRKQIDGKKDDGSGEGTNKKFLQGEAQKSGDILQRVMSGSYSKEKERDVKRGKYATGETGHDYDFDDGLGPDTFRKKKGRAGMGKMRKITKKRIK